jgi:hypothetical protein
MIVNIALGYMATPFLPFVRLSRTALSLAYGDSVVTCERLVAAQALKVSNIRGASSAIALFV